MDGYTGSILRVNLTTRSTTIIDTDDYKAWGGGHGMGSAIFFDLVTDKTIDGFDPDNVVTIMTSPLSGTLTPGCSSRTEVQGIGVQSYPKEWFTRSNFGGRFSAMLKFAGWDGIVIEGASDVPVWLDIRDDTVEIRNCTDLSLWGTDTRVCQETLWEYVTGTDDLVDWYTANSENGARSTQLPAVLAIGQAGENLSRIAALIHDAGNASGQGGFGAVWGSKKLKAISVAGTGSIGVSDPSTLINARIEQKEYACDVSDVLETYTSVHQQSAPGRMVIWELVPFFKQTGGKRPQACMGCHSGCRRRYESGLGNEASCSSTAFYMGVKKNEYQYRATDLLNQFGINALEAHYMLEYLRALDKEGALGPGKDIDCPLNFSDYGSWEFVEQFLKMIAYRNDGLGNDHAFGNSLAEGIVRAAGEWGRLEDDLATGFLPYPYWGYPIHYDPRAQLEWGYGTILGDRDINEHCFYNIYRCSSSQYYGGQKKLSPEEVADIVMDKMVPFQDDRAMLDYSSENMYSEHMSKLVAWQRYYTRFWKQSALFCDNRWPDFVNPNAPDMIGSTGTAEPIFYNAVTGGSLTFQDGIELGRKIWNLDQAIWCLQGRHRDMVQFSEYIYSVPFTTLDKKWLGKENGQWNFLNVSGRTVDRDKFEEFKTLYYQLEGWDIETGYPTRSTLETLGLKDVADELELQGKLGMAS